MKPFDYYSKPEIPYPNKKNYITYYAYSEGECLYKGSNFYTSKQEVEKDYPNAVIQVVLDEEVYKAHLKQYTEETQKLNQEFQDDLFEEFGVTNNPKRHKCFCYAWYRGHSSGYSEVYGVFGDIVELIIDEY